MSKSKADLIARVEAVDLPNADPLIDRRKTQNANLDKSIKSLTELNSSAGTSIDSTTAAANCINSAAQNSLNAADTARTAITIPAPYRSA